MEDSWFEAAPPCCPETGGGTKDACSTFPTLALQKVRRNPIEIPKRKKATAPNPQQQGTLFPKPPTPYTLSRVYRRAHSRNARMARFLSAPLLSGTLLAACVITGGEAFVGSTSLVSKAPLQQQQQHRRRDPRMHRRCSTLPVAMLGPQSRPRRARRMSSGSLDGRGGCSTTSRRTALFSTEGGAPTPTGPGTQNLSREAKLAISVLIDIIGVSSFAVPGVGEVSA